MTDPLMDIVRVQGFTALVEQSPDAVYVLDPDGRFIFANSPLLLRLNQLWDDVAGTDFRSTVAPADRSRVNQEFALACRGEVAHYRASGLRPDGSIFFADVVNFPIRHNGDVVAIVGMARDMDEVEGLQRSRHALENRLSAALNAITDGIYFLDRNWLFTWVNPPGEKLAGLELAQLLGNSIWELFPELTGSEFGIAYRKAVADRETVTVRDKFTTLDAWLEITAYPVDDGLAIYARDVTEEEFVRQRIVESEKRIASQAALLDIARDAIIVRRVDHTIEYWNRAAEEIYGWTSEEVIGRSVREILYEDPAAFEAATAYTIENGQWAGELEQTKRSGEKLVADCRWSLVRDAAGRPESIFAVNSDITLRKREEAVHLRAQRMESLGTLSGGIAHDLNNILTPMLMSVQMLARDESDPDRAEILGIIEASVKRGAAMIRQVLSFARGVEGQRFSIDVARIIADVTSFSREAMPRSITVVSGSEPGLATVIGDSTQLLQVMLNLVTNARDAMPAGGTVSIGARNLLDATSGTAMVVLSVRDTGSGIDPSALPRIFEPFFTTKPVGEGTGLGLATSAAIIASHEGRIEVESAPGEGSAFHIYLPAAKASAVRSERAVPVSDVREVPRGNGDLVLVVDDEAAIRRLTRHTLEEFGYTSAAASNGDQAIEYIRAQAGAVNLVITDVTMPGMDGPALVESLAREFPRIPVILTSGAAGVDVTGEIRVARFLPKPFTTVQLLTAVAAAIHRGQRDA